MDKVIIRIQTDGKAKLPVYSSQQAAGADICACLTSESVVIKSGEFAMIPTGLHLQLPEGFEAQIRPRSGLAAKFGITVLNTPGTIDSDYRGEIKVILINHGKESFTVNDGDRIAQMVIARHCQAEFETVFALDQTERGNGGFGSTGIKG